MLGWDEVLGLGTCTRELPTLEAALFKIGVIRINKLIIRHGDNVKVDSSMSQEHNVDF